MPGCRGRSETGTPATWKLRRPDTACFYFVVALIHSVRASSAAGANVSSIVA